MKLLIHVLAVTRGLILSREMSAIEREVAGLSVLDRRVLANLALRELAQASKTEYPHLYGSQPSERYRPWGTGTTVAMERARSDNSQIKLRGIAMWLAISFHESKESEFSGLKSFHRRVLKMMRQLKESLGNPKGDAAQQWFAQAA